MVWLSLFTVAPISRVSALRSSGLPRRAGNPKIAHPHLPCPQAPLQSLTTAASLSTPVPALPSADPFGSAPSRGGERLPASRWPSAGEPTNDQLRPEGRNPSMQHPFDPDGGDLRRSCTSRESMGRGRGTNPKVCTGPPRAKVSRPKPGYIATEPPRAGVASHRRRKREPAAPSLSETTRRSVTGRRVPPASPPTRLSEERLIVAPLLPLRISPMRESDAHSLCPFGHHRSLPIVSPQQAARPSVTIRAIASDPASTRRLRFRESSHRFHPTARRTPEGTQQKVRCFERSCHGHIVWSV